MGRLWTANQRVVDGPLEAVLADDEVDVGAGGYDIGARARQIRDDLLGLTHPATEADMLAIQLDSRALFVARWRDLLLALHRRGSHARCAAPPRVPRLVSQWKPDGGAGRRWVTGWCATYRGDMLDALWRGLVAGLLGDETSTAPARRSSKAAGWRLVERAAAGDRAAGRRRLARVSACAARRRPSKS